MTDRRPPDPSAPAPSGSVPSGSVPSGSVPSGSVPSGSVPSGSGQPPEEGPSDRTTLTAVVDAYRASGFAGDFYAEEAGSPNVAGAANEGTAVVRCGRCSSSLDPHALEMHSIRRLEGASDPADMSAVVATTCPVCGNDGTLVVSYGPMASAVDADVFLAMRDRRVDDVLPPDLPPDEVTQPDGGHPRPA